jgi:Tfp pilus assembly protein PilV
MKGFTLIEALVALTLLTVGLIPAFVQASSAIALATTVRNSIIAANLAQEGVEAARAIRDANWFASQPFATGLDACAPGCQFSFGATALTPSLNERLKLDSVSGLYQYERGTDTPFTRTITVTQASAGELVVTSTVMWSERTSNKQFVVEEHLFDWIQ